MFDVQLVNGYVLKNGDRLLVKKAINVFGKNYDMNATLEVHEDLLNPGI